MRHSVDFDGFQQLLWSFAKHHVIIAAVRTGVFAGLRDAPTKPEQLAEALNLDSLATGKVVRALCAMGIVRPVGEGSYQLVDEIAEIFQVGAGDMTPFVEHIGFLSERWNDTLEPWLRGEEPPAQRPPSSSPASFGAAMQAVGGRVVPMVTQALDLMGVKRIVDLGGGFGHYAQAFCRVNADATATVVDRPEVAQLAGQKIKETDLADRIVFVGGDYLEATIPDAGSYDLALVANVLHQEGVARAAQLVKRAAKVLRSGGRIAIVEFAIDDAQHDHLQGALFAINMRSFGDTYPASQIRMWLTDAGFSRIDFQNIGEHRWLITATAG